MTAEKYTLIFSRKMKLLYINRVESLNGDRYLFIYIYPTLIIHVISTTIDIFKPYYNYVFLF